MNKFMTWFREPKNIRNVNTGATIVFIVVFILYFYGFRTGFQFELINPFDVIADILIIITASVAIINDYSKRGVYDELDANDDVRDTENEHARVVDETNIEHMATGLVLYNEKEYEDKRRRKRDEIIAKLKRRIRILRNKPPKKQHRINALKKKQIHATNRQKVKLERRIARLTHPPRLRHIARLEDILRQYGNDDVYIRVKHRYIHESELLTKGVGDRTKREIDTNYNPARAVLKNQSGFVVTLAIVLSVLRVMLEPSFASFMDFIVFITILTPILITRAITSYIAARYNTANKYKYAIQKKIRIIQWCATHAKKEGA